MGFLHDIKRSKETGKPVINDETRELIYLVCGQASKQKEIQKIVI